MRRFFRWMNADWDQFKALLITSIRIDFRGQSGRKKRKVSPVFISLFFYVFMGAFLAGNLAPKTTPFIYTLLVLSYSMVMMIFFVMIELGHTIINPDDADVLAHRPLSSRTYFLARLFNLLFFIAVMGLALCFFPAVLGMLVKGNTWFYPLLFLAVSLLANIAVGAAVLLLYTLLLRFMHYEKMKDVIAYLQIGFAFIIFFFYQVIPRLSLGEAGPELLTKRWLIFIPPAWFAGLVHLLSGGPPASAMLAATAAAVSLLLAFFGFRRISVRYAGMLSELQAPAIRTEPRTAERRLTGTSGLDRILGKEGAAGFHFVNMQLKRDRSVKMALYPIFGIPLAMIALALIEGGLPDPFTVPVLSQGGYTIMIQGFIFFMIYFFVKGIEYCQHYEAAWLFYAAPLVSPGRFYRGVKSALLIRLVLPFFLLTGLIYATQIPLMHALRHCLTLLLLGLNAFSGVSLLIREYPFSKKRERGDRAQRFGFLLVAMPFLGAALLLETFAYRSLTGWIILAGSLLVSFMLLERLTVNTLNRRLRALECSL